jgi:hypothetical protein
MLLVPGCCFAFLVGCGRSHEDVAEATEPKLVVMPSSGKDKTDAKKPADQEKPAPPEKPFAFPDDPGGKELANKLPPRVTGTLPALPVTDKLTWPTAPGATRLTLPLLSTQVPLPRLPQTTTTAPLLPGAVPEDLPLSDDTSLSLPAEPKLETGPPVRASEENQSSSPLVKVSEPTPTPVGATDLTRDASWQAALSASWRPRNAAVPFVPQNLPDPFANRKTANLPDPATEDLTPVVANPAVPNP